MTTLAIMATYEKKRLKCYGTVAAGEHVAVTVTDGAQWIGEGKALRLRVLFGPDTVGVFPFADGDAWTATGTQNADAYCELNLNTLQAEKYLKHGGTCLWILDDVENHTLYATGEFEVLPWPKRRGIDEPIDLDGYPLLLDEIKDLKEAFEEYQRTVAQMLATKQDTIFDLATIRSGAAAGATAVQPSQIARFVDGAEYRQSYGKQNNPAILFMHGTDVIVALDATPFVKDGMVSSVEVVGGNLVITFNTDSGKQPITVPLTDIFNPANYYDKDAVNALLNAKQDALTFDNAPTSGSSNPVKSGGIWSMLWGALAALPTGFSSLYDWVVAQLAGKQSTLSAQQLANIAAVSDALAFDATRSYAAGDPVVYNGTLYTFTAAHTGAWTGSDVSAVDIIARLAGKLGNTGDQTLDGSLSVTDSLLVGSEYTPHIRTGNESAGIGDYVEILGYLINNGTIYNNATLSCVAEVRQLARPVDYYGLLHTYRVGDLIASSDTLYKVVTEFVYEGDNSWLSNVEVATVQDVLAALRTALAGKADKCVPQAAGNLAALDANGNPTDSQIPAMGVALKVNIPYCIVTKNIENGAVTLDNHASNSVTITATLSPNALTINFPPLLDNSMVHDFAMRLNIAAGVTAPEIAWPQGVTLENDGGEMPEIADGGTGGSSTILYFSETENDGTTAKFLVKGDVLQTITA